MGRDASEVEAEEKEEKKKEGEKVGVMDEEDRLGNGVRTVTTVRRMGKPCGSKRATVGTTRSTSSTSSNSSKIGGVGRLRWGEQEQKVEEMGQEGKGVSVCALMML
jgi:hypothetical protein|eukprot:evm.model.NODE_9431_length_13702_cov_18.337761.3